MSSRERMYQGKLNKARRGELAGYAPRSATSGCLSGEWGDRPGPSRSRRRVHLVIRRVRPPGDAPGPTKVPSPLTRSASPIRPTSGANRGNLEWRRPNRMTLQNLLHHPTYGRSLPVWTSARGFASKRGRAGPARASGNRRPEECLVLIRDRHPGLYHVGGDSRPIRIVSKPTVPGRTARGAPRARVFAAGRVDPVWALRGGGCSSSMRGANDRLSYRCTRGSGDYAEPQCQCLSGPFLDGFIRDQILSAVAPGGLGGELVGGR